MSDTVGFPPGRPSRNWTDDAWEREDLLVADPSTAAFRRDATPPASFETRSRDLERTCRNLRRGFVVMTLVCACVVVVLVFPWWSPPFSSPSSSPSSRTMPGQSQVMADEIPIEPVLFHQDPRFAGPSNGTTDASWASLMPLGDGFILLANAAKAQAQARHSPAPPRLQPGQTSTRHPDAEIYDVSLFHQLHCLTHIRTYLYTLRASLNATSPADTYRVVLQPQEAHVEHCLDYLRQAVMCAGDLTLEWPRTEEDGRRFAVDGWGVEHQCKSWDVIMRYMEENTVARHW